MKRTFLYTLSISLAGLLTLAAQAQVKPARPAGDTSIRRTAADTSGRKPTQRPLATTAPRKVDTLAGGVRIGLDISRFALHFFQPYRTDVTVQADARIGRKLYAAAEAGYNRTSHSDTSYTYKGNGVFTTIGVDYDFLKKKDLSEKNMVYGGIRYGFARNTYEAPAFTIHNDYWDAETSGSIPKTNMTAHWIELVFGMRVEALPNFFLGWGLREKIMISNNALDGFDPIVIPGYGSGAKRSQFDMTYTLSYYLPLYKIKSRVPLEKKKD